MPYTATVGLALTSTASTKLKAYTGSQNKADGIKIKRIFKSADIHKVKRGSQLYYWNCIDWRHDSEPRICLGTFLNTIPSSEYHLCLVGDDPNDNHDRGLFNDPWNMLLLREVIID